MELFTGLFRESLFGSLGNAVVCLALALIRVLSFMHFAPIFSNKGVPSYIRLGMSLLLTSMLAPRVLDQGIPEGGYSIVFAVLSNIVIGFILGFTVNLLFYIVVAGGEMMDASMGFSSAQIFDPSLGGQTTIMGKFMSMLSAVVFLTIGGPEMLLQGIAGSFDKFNIYLPTININIFKIVHLCGDIIRLGFVITSPVILTILVNDIVLGLVSRAAPQINAFQISFTIKPTIGLLVWLLTLPLFFSALQDLLLNTGKLF